MNQGAALIAVIVAFAFHSACAQSTPVDVDSDGIVGPAEVIDLSANWKGPALSLGAVQPWQSNGTSIFYNAGAVGIGTDSPSARLQVNDGRIRIRETATLERWDYFYDPPSEKFYLQENAAFNHLVFTKGPDSRLGIGTDAPAAGTRLHVLTAAGTAVLGESPLGNGVIGRSSATGFGASAGTHSGTNGIGVYGEANTGTTSYGVYGKSVQGTAVCGVSELGDGVVGVSTTNSGVDGRSSSGSGVDGISSSASGVRGESSTGAGVLGRSAFNHGVYGYSERSVGVYGTTEGGDMEDAGVFAHSGNPTLSPALRVEGFAVVSSSLRVHTLFVDGDIFVDGTVVELKRTTRIDHPLDPANRYLSHSSVGSSEMKNVYDGNVVTDDKGNAEVFLPDWFESFNKDYRYQLTVIDGAGGDGFVLAKVAKKIENNRFSIRTSAPNTEVSWQVTGIRNDAYANAHPLEVETEKESDERGKYLNPEAFGKPKEMGIYYQPDSVSQSNSTGK